MNRIERPGSRTRKSSGPERIKVCIRLRPLLAPYEDEEVWGVDPKESKIQSINSNLASALDPGFSMPGSQVNINAFIREKELRRRYQDAVQTQSFQFDNVFGPDVQTPAIYSTIVRPITKAALQGYNGTVFMYGQTTSGKTYTMLGTPDIPGILPCAIRDVFNGIKADRDVNDYNVWVSYLEIYNECINDLLAPGKANLKIKDDPNHGVDVAQLNKQQVFSFEQAILLMNYGEDHRVYKETSIHEHSSRSHTIFRVYMESWPKGNPHHKKYSMLNLVDLAGSERLNEFDCKTDHLGETGHINKSLFVLSNVINKLAEGKSAHIPYRDSKLTRILQMALGGNSLTAIICTISPASINYYQTLSTLRFATRAKIVKNKPTVNELVDGGDSVQQYQMEIDKLRDELAVKDSQLIKFQEYHQQLQDDLIQEKEIKERLMSEIKDPIELDVMRLRLEQEQIEKHQLLNELENVKSDPAFTGRKSERDDLQFVNGITTRIETLILRKLKDSQFDQRAAQQVRGVPENKLLLSSNPDWQRQVSSLSHQYLQDITHLQNEYRNKLKTVIEGIFDKENLLREAILETELRPKAVPGAYNTQMQAQVANNKLVLDDIDGGKVFDDIIVEYEQVLESGFSGMGYNIEQLSNNMVLPSFEDAESVAEDLKQYYIQVIQVCQKRFDEVKGILEVFYRSLVTLKREELDLKHASDLLSEEDFAIEQSTFSRIAEEHHDKLKKLRESFEGFNQSIDTKFDDIMKKLRQWSGYGEEDRLSSSFRNSEQEGSIISLNPSESKGLKLLKDSIEKGNRQNRFGMRQPLGGSQASSLKEEPPEINTLDFQQHDIVSHTPKFTFASKNQAGSQKLLGKENSMAVIKHEKLLPRATVEVKNGLGSRAYVWGSGKDGRCGNGKETNEKVPTQVVSKQTFKMIACGYHHSAGVSKDGAVLTWGRGIFGQLGHGDTQNYSLPTPVEALLKVQIAQVACGWQHTMALSTQGRVFTWGYGEDGQLGHGDTHDQLSPREVDFFKKNGIKIALIATGHSHSGCISETAPARLYTWGANSDHRLMTEDSESRFTPSLTVLEKMKDRLESNEPWSLSLGVTHSAVVTRSGEVITGGSKVDGQLGIKYIRNGTSPKSQELSSVSMHTVEGFGIRYNNKATQVACGDSYTLVLNDRNDIFSFGKATHGRLGVGQVDEADHLYEPTLIDSIKDDKIIQISAGCRHAACITESGKLYAWGFNFYEQLGLGDSERDYDVPMQVILMGRARQVACGYFHTGALID